MLGGAVHFALHAHPALANPMGAQVVAGGVQIENAGNVLNIHQSTDRAIIHWQDFSIGAGEVTNFIQNGGGASVLNRVTGGNASQLLGTLNANGQVCLLNPNGVFIGQGAVVNVGSFMATTADVADDGFMKGGNLSFVGATDGKIVNEGSIHAHSGDVLLMAKTVENKGTIQAGEGTAALLAGKDFYLKKDEPGAIKVQVTAGADGSAAGVGVANSGTIEAMQAQLEAQGNVYALAINQAGIIRATGVSRDASGVVVLSAPGGLIRQTGTMLAINRDGSGGRLSISGRDIAVEASSIMTAAGSGVTGLAMGGQIEISAEQDAILDGRLDVSSGDGAKGGRLVVTGERVGLLGGKVNASGGTGGGEVLLGGDYLGLNPLIRNAKATVMSGESEIIADATVAGDGGKVILWSDEYTGFFGSISAQGGAVSGNGGFVETSSKDNLQVFGNVNAFAPQGVSGNWLIDPSHVNITTATANGTFNSSSPNVFTPNADSATVLVTTINNSLNAGTSVIINTETASATTQNGNITVSSAISKTAGGNASLTLNAGTTGAAGGNITVNAAITSTAGNLNVILNAPSGTVTLGAGIDTSFGGTLAGALTVTAGGATGTVTQNAATTIDIGGNLTITATGAISQANAATSVLKVGGATSVGTLVGADISFSGTSNNFVGQVSIISGRDVTIVDGVGGLDLGPSVIQRNLSLTSTGGNITDSGVISAGAVGSTTTLSASGFNIALDQSGNNFATIVVSAAQDVTLLDVNAMILGNMTVSNDLSITTNGAITNSGTLAVTGKTTLTAGSANNITLGSAANNFVGSVNVVSGNDAVFVDGTADLPLGDINLNGNLTVTASAGNITSAGTLLVDGDVSVTANAGNVNLTSGQAINISSASVGVGTLTVNSTGVIDFNGATAINLAGLSLTTTAGGINQSGSGTITVVGATALNTGTSNDVTLDNSNEFQGDLSIAAARNVTLVGTGGGGAIRFGNATTSGTLTVTAAGAITQAAATSITVNNSAAASFTTGGSVITLTRNNDFTGAVSLRNTGANDVQITDANALTLGTLSIGRNLTVLANGALNLGQGTVGGLLTANSFNGAAGASGAISQAGALTVTTTTSLTAGANAITLNNPLNNFTQAVTLSNSGNNNISLTDQNAIILGTSSVGTGTLTVNAVGITQTGAITQAAAAGAATFNGGAGVITLTLANDFTGAVSLSNSGAFNVQITDANALTLGTLSIGQNLTVLANGALNLGQGTVGGLLTANSFNGAAGASGPISQAGALTVTTTTSLTAGANAITLNNPLNNFTQAVTLSNSGNNNISLTDQNAIILGTSSVGSGTLTVNAVGITQDAGATITQAAGAGAATFNAGAGVITLVGTGNNNFTGAVSLNNGGNNNVQVTDANAIVLGTSSVGTGTLVINAVGITQTGAITQAAAAGAATFNGGAGVITLTQANDFTGAVSLNNSGNNNVQLTDADAIILGTSSVGTGTLTINAVGITQTGAGITQAGVEGAGGAVTMNAGLGVITLTLANDFTGAVSLNNSGNNNVQVTDADAIVLGTSSVGAGGTGNLTVTATGANSITQTGVLTVTGTSSFTTGAGAITLTLANLFTGAVSLNNTGNNNVQVTDANAIILGTSSVGAGGTGNLTVTATGANSITQTGVLTVTGTSSFTTGAGAITLTLANLFTGAVSLNNSGNNNVQVTDANAIILGTSSVGTGTLQITATGANSITQTGAITQATGAGAATFTTGDGAITLTQNNNFTGAVSLNNTGNNNVQVTDANAIILGTSSVGAGGTGNLTVTSGAGLTAGTGGVSQSGALTVTGLTTLNSLAASTDIDLSTQANTFTGGVAIGNTGSPVLASNVRDFKLRNTSATAGAVTGLGNATTTNLRDLTIIYNNAAYQVPSLTMASLRNISITAGGVINQAAGGIVQGVAGATASFTTGNFAITLTDPLNNFLGSVSLANTGANNVQITDANALTLGTLSIGQNLTVLANGALNLGQGTIGGFLSANSFNGGVGSSGAITQTGALTVTTTTSLTAGANAITLDNPLNNFTQAVTLSNSGNNNISLTDQNAIILGTSSVGTGSLTVNAVGITQTGAITQAAAAGAATFNGGAGVITLTQANDFTGAVSLNNSGAFNVQITDADSLNLGASSVGGNFTATASLGNITSSGAIQITGNSTFNADAPGANITLSNAVNVFTGTVSFAGTGGLGAVTVVDTTSLDLTTLTAASLTATGAGLTDSGILTIAGATSLTAGAANNIVLDSANQFGGAVSVVSANNVTLVNAIGIDLGASMVSGNYTVTATTGNITDSGNLNVAGVSTFNANAAGATITLNSAGNFFTGAVSFGGTGGLGNVTVVNSSGLILGASTLGAGANLVATFTRLSQTGALVVPGTTTLTPSAASADIDLSTQANNLTGTITVNNPANVRDFKLRNISGVATVPGVDLMTNLRDLTLIFNATGLSLASALTSPSLRNVLLTANGLINYSATGNTTLSGNLTATSTANGISQTSTGGWVVGGVTTLAAATTGNINLQSAGNNLQGGLTIASGQNVSLQNSGSLTVGNTAVSGGTVLLAGGTVLVSGTQTTGITSDLLFQSTGGDIQLAPGSSFSSRNITLAGVNLVNNAGSSPFTNQGSGRTLVFSTSPSFNQPTDLNGGFSGFGQVYLQSPSITLGGVGIYTVNNSLPSGNLMVYSSGLPITDASASVLNENVDLIAYKGNVPVLGYSLPTIYSGQVRLGFKAAAAAVQNSLGRAEPAQPPEKAGRLRVGDAQRASKTEPVANSTPGNANPGRLGVGQLNKQKSKSEVGSAGIPGAKPMVRAGNVSLRMSGEFYPFELAEVAIGGAKLSQFR